jgi:NADPH:quinone reductase-like Zn-dependent oxidoreductase
MTRKLKITVGVFSVLAVAVIALSAVLAHDSPCAPAPPPRAGAALMKAAMYRCYGSSEVIRIEQIEKPTPANDELLVRVHAAGVNPLDFHYLHGTPYLMRMGSGVGAPTDPLLGVDFAGSVEAIGKDVKNFHVGDEVFGGHSGAFGEYLVVRESRNVVLKPANISFEEAAAVPIAAITALQALRDKGKLQAGQKVLVNGASGGVGTYAVQIAKNLGATVTGVCSTRNVEMVRGLGADLVVDYSREDFVKRAERYDVIVDAVGNRDLAEIRSVLTPKGIHVMVGGPNRGNWLGPLSGALKAVASAPFVDQTHSMMLAELTPQDLAVLRDFLAAGKLRSVIDRRYPLEQVAAAVDYVEAGHSRGKVVVLVP